MQKYRMLVAGEWVDPASGEWFESYNPYTGSPWALVPRAGREDVNRAVAAGPPAFESEAWRGLSAIREYTQEKSVWIDTSGEVANPFIMR